jgi:hypothetical protein
MHTAEMWSRTKQLRMMIPLIVSLCFFVPSFLFKFIWLDLQNVHISDAQSIHEAKVDVDRKTIMGGYMKFHVTFRDASDDLRICEMGDGPFRYKANLSNPIRDKTIAWWSGGAENAILKGCEADGLRDGEFYAITCHDALLSELIPITIATRCVVSNVFKLGDAS